MLQDILPDAIIKKKNESELWVELINNSRISLKGCDNEDSLVGVGLDFIVPDEYALYKPHVWPKILRPMLTDRQGGALFIGTPRGKNAFYDLYLRGQRNEKDWASWQHPTSANPFIALEEIEEAKKTLPERVFNQEYLARFEDFVGLVYPEFHSSHIVEPYHIPAIYPRIGAIDPAISGTTGVLKAALDEDGNMIVYSEYYERDKRVSEVCHEIQEDNIKWLIDPSSQAKSQRKEGKLFSLYDEYGDYGIFPIPAENDVESGINRVGEWFKKDRIKIFSSCKHLIWELERYHWSEERETVAGILKPRPYKKDDHLCDDLKYLVASRSTKADMTMPVYIHPNSPRAKLNEMKKRREESFVY